MRFTRLIKTKLAGTMIVALCVAALAPAFAAAQDIDPTTSQYGDNLTQIETGTNVCVDDGDTDTGTGVDTDGDGVIDTCVPPQTNVTNSQPPTGLGGRVGPLPFTGFDVIAMAAVALAVAGLGLALQRAVSRQPTDGTS